MSFLSKKILGVVYPISILLFFISVYLLLIVNLYFLNRDMMFGNGLVAAFSITFLIIFHILIILIIYCYFYVMFTNPGEPPLFWGFNDRPEDRKRRYCGICNKFKPERCHHCSTCNRCVLVMDHHCPWLRNCVGFKNRKIFMLLLIYSAILDVFSIMFSLYPLIKMLIELVTGNTTHLIHFIFGLIGLGLAITFCFIIWLFLKYHFRLID